MPLVRALGPVFERERVVAARGRRFYVLRFAVGLALLGVIVASGRATEAPLEFGTIAGVQIAATLFQNLLLTQGLAVVFLTPALVAGAIAQEYQRRTLHELLASDLTSAEIVLGKLAARLSYVAVLAATGLPIVLATGLLGGVPLSLVLGSLAATISTALFLGSLLSGGSLLVTLPILALRPLALTACGPLLLALSLASHGDLQGKPAAGSFGPFPDAMLAAVWVGRGPEMALTCLASVLGAALGAWALIRSACRGFDACLDRPALTGPRPAFATVSSHSGVPPRPRTRLLSLRHPLTRR